MDRDINMLDEDTLYIYFEPLKFSLYLVFIFLSVQIWFLWKDVDKDGSKIRSFFDESFFIKNCIYVYSFSVYFIIHGFTDGTNIPVNYLRALEMLTLTSLILFT